MMWYAIRCFNDPQQPRGYLLGHRDDPLGILAFRSKGLAMLHAREIECFSQAEYKIVPLSRKPRKRLYRRVA